MDSSEIRTQLARLHIERIDATEIGLADNDVYMADLEEEILECRTQLAIAAVTEVAVARAEHTGRLLGRTSCGPNTSLRSSANQCIRQGADPCAP